VSENISVSKANKSITYLSQVFRSHDEEPVDLPGRQEGRHLVHHFFWNEVHDLRSQHSTGQDSTGGAPVLMRVTVVASGKTVSWTRQIEHSLITHSLTHSLTHSRNMHYFIEVGGLLVVGDGRPDEVTHNKERP
jgi:hypothetical protein